MTLMTNELWINLPVEDVNKSKAFYLALGFSDNPRGPDSEQMASVVVGKQKVVLMLVSKSHFRDFTGHKVADASEAGEVLISIDAESREEVDELVRKAENAGGSVYGKASESDGWMYGAGFADLDGHRWNVLFMDQEKAGKG